MKKLIFSFYGMLLFLFAFFSYLFVESNIPVINTFYSDFVFSKRGVTAIIYSIFILLLFACYVYFILSARKKILKKKDLKILIFITIGILFFSYPAMLSYDIFNYMATSKVFFFYHENPYIVMPIELSAETLLSFMHAANKVALYGPAWIILTGIPFFLGKLGFIFSLFAFKLFIVPFYLGTIFLIWKMSKNIISLYLFSLNPLVIIETLLSGHNDIVMMFFLLFSFFLIMKDKVKFAVLFFLLSIFIKYTTILLLPIFLYLVLSKIRKTLINWEKIFYYSGWITIFGFLLSPIREEIYPWYAMWFLPFSFLTPNRKFLLSISIALSFGLLFRYVPFIFSGTHAGLTPIIKFGVTFIPVSLVLIYFVVKKLWVKISYR